MASTELRRNMKATARKRNVEELRQGRKQRAGFHRNHARYDRKVKHRGRRDW